MMLITSSALPYYKDEILLQAQAVYDNMVAFEKERIEKRKALEDKSLEKAIEDLQLVELEKKTSLNELISSPLVKLDEFIQIEPVELPVDDEASDKESEEAKAAADQEEKR